MRRFAFGLLFMLSFCLVNPLVRAEGEGQKDLDEAADLQLAAETLADFEKIIGLAEGAIKKGLDKGQEEFARKMLAATLYQHAERSCKAIFEQSPPTRNWQAVRQISLRNLEKAKKNDAKLPDQYILIAKLQSLPGGDAAAAKEAIDMGVDLLKENPKEQAKALILRGQMVEGIDAKLENFDSAAKADPDNLQALQGRALLYLEKGENEKAMADLAKLLEKDASNVAALESISDVLTRLKKYDEAITYIEKVIALNPTAAPGYILRARLLALKEDNKAALEDLNKALEIDPRNILGLLMRGQVHAALNQDDKAKEDVEAAARLAPDLPQAILMRSMLAAQQKRYGEAIADIKILLHSDPKNEEYRLQLASYMVADKRPRKAIEILDAIVEDNEKNEDALRARGDAYLSVSKHAEAVADYEKALALDPEDTGVLNNLAWVLATSTKDDVRNGKKSIEYGIKACELTKYNKPHILSTLASGYAEAGDFETAIKWSSKAVELGADPEIKEQLGKELESYKAKMPWREDQNVEENTKPLSPKKDDLET